MLRKGQTQALNLTGGVQASPGVYPSAGSLQADEGLQEGLPFLHSFSRLRSSSTAQS